MKKRILSILLLCCMVLTLLPTTAFAADESPAVTNVTVTFDSNGGGEVESQTIQQGQQVQRPADPVKEGYTFIGWYDKNDLDNKYYNMPEWNFSYPVTKDLELVAQWMETRPISTEPITYLDKDGNRQVCNKYTVLTSNTADSILDLDDKWYDLPAGWYVVKGGVTITPRLDTHGAVNLILTDGSHLTAEWGINVKEGDTFTVYAQSTGEDTMGRLTACLSEDLLAVEYYVWPDYGLSGIGSSRRWRKANSGINENGGTIIINGGNIHAKGQDSASAIGECGYDTVTQSPSSEGRQCGSITINGGIVRTEALTRETTGTSIGIGSCRSGYGGSVTINGGTVMANAFNDAICTGRGGSITINGGDITARGGLAGLGRGNGIGPSWIASADITINGGNIDASTNRKGAAIGGVLSTTVKITGGTIKAVGDYATVAIGSNEGRGGSVSITGGKVTAIGKGDADGIGGYADVSITGGEIDVSVEGSGVAIGGNAGGSINIQGNAIKSISSRSGACIGGSAKNITILDAELPFLGGEGLLIGNEVGDNTGGDLTIRNCRILSTDIAANRGIQVGNNGNIQIENSEIMLSRAKGIRTGDGGSIAIRDSQLVTNGIYMVEGGTTQRKLKRLEITNSTVVTSDAIGSKGNFTSVGEIVIHGSSIRQSEDYGNGYSIGCGDYGSFDRIDIQDSQIDIPGANYGAAIGGGKYTTDPGNSVIRIANSRVFARTRDRWSTAIGRDIGSSGDGALRIFIENSTVTAKGGWLFGDGTEYVPGIGISYKSSLNAYIQVMDSTVESFRHTKSRNMDDSDYVYDDLHTKKLPGNPAENISICGSTVNGTRIDHSLDAYGKCTLCGKYDIGYCYKNGLLTMEGLTDCAYDGSEKKLTGLSHKTGENETKQLTENTDYTATYSNNVYPYTLNPNDAGFDPEKAPKVTLYGTGNYCGKAEHYFTISGDEQPSYTVKFDTAGGTSISNKTGVRWEQRVLDGVEPPTRTDYEFRGWSCSGKPVFPGTTYADLAGDKNVQSITLTAQWAAAWYPEGEIKIEGEDTVWNGFESDYSARFYNTEQTVTISAPKSGGKPVEIGYLITDEDLTKARCTKRDFTPYTEPLKLNTDGWHIVYAKLTNAEGNVTYLRTTGRIVIDTTPPAINGVEDGEVYYTTKNVQITDDNLASVTVNGSPKTVGGYNTIWIALFSDANRTYKIVATDKAGNRTEKTITVYDGTYVIPVTGVSLDESSITLDVGGNQTLTATVTPEDATNKKVCWSSDNEAVATVSEDGVVTAVAGGTAVITATTHDGLFTASCTVTVNAPATAPNIITDTLPDGKVGEAYSQTLTANGTTPIKWSIDGGLPAGLSLNADTGEISGTPTAEGTATFTVKATNSAGSNTKELSITITKAAPAEHTITVTTEGGGTASASSAKAVVGTEIRLTAKPDEGYRFKEWEVMSGNVTIKDDKFLMPDSNVEVKAIFEEDAPPAPTEHTVTVTSSGNGTASASPAKAVAGAEITLSATPDKGYHLKEWQVISGGVSIKDNKFTMPDSNVEVKAVFEEDAPPAPTDPAKPSISVTGTYTYNGSEHTAAVNGYDPSTMDISGNTATDAGDYTVRVTSKTGKWVDGSTDAVTAAWSIGKATQEAPNGLTGVAPTTEGGSDGKITGVDATMEYRMAGESSYTACSGTEIENLSAGNYFVRYAEDNNHFAGTDAEVTVGKGAPLADCTITFDGNGGSGSMGPVTVKAGANYILPECGFTAPTDQEFKAWEISGTEYKVGDTYIVSGDTEIKALWENSVITPTTYTVTVGNDGNGTGTATPSTAVAGTTIILTATPNTGYHFKEWQVISGGVTIKDDKFLMPNDNVEVKAIFEKDAPPAPTEFTITVKTDGNGTASASHTKAVVGTEIALTATPNKGYHFKEWQVESPAGLVITNNKFTMPDSDVEVKAIFEKDAPPAPTEFTITVTSGDNGTASASHAKAVVGTEITLTATPNKGYHFKEWQVISGGVTIKDDKFTMPSANVEVKAIFEKDTGGGGGGYNPPVTYYTLRFETGGGSDIPSVQGTYNTYIDLTKYVPTWRGHTFIGWYTERSLMNKVSGVYLTKDMTVYALWRVDENPNTGANPFTDVSEKDWFYGDVMFVYENGLMLGTSKTLFSPHGTATRGMMATILWRMEGSPAPKGKNSFTDVEAGKWYADAITWTAENGIFAGYGKDKFGPDDPITREQLAAIFYRYADYKGYDLTVKGNLDKFKDSDKITDYAKTAMQWAVGSGLVKGKSGNLLDPQGTATRAEIAAMLHRFIEKYELVQGKAPGGLMGWIDPKRLQIPKTGDSSVLGLWGISLCTSLAGCLVLTTWQIRRRREEEALQIIEK